jgi:hypothetical protein
MAKASELTDAEVDMLLERFDKTDPKLQRRIVADFVGKTIVITDENERLRKANADLLAACNEVLRRWTFDNYQRHTHTWHDMQDCAAKIRAVITAAGGAA